MIKVVVIVGIDPGLKGARKYGVATKGKLMYKLGGPVIKTDAGLM